MQNAIPVLGFLAAAFTSLSYIPQVRKALPRDSTEDLSLKMLCALTTGLCLWVIYGLIRGDMAIIIANIIGALLSATVLVCKVRDKLGRKS